MQIGRGLRLGRSVVVRAVHGGRGVSAAEEEGEAVVAAVAVAVAERRTSVAEPGKAVAEPPRAVAGSRSPDAPVEAALGTGVGRRSRRSRWRSRRGRRG